MKELSNNVFQVFEWIDITQCDDLAYSPITTTPLRIALNVTGFSIVK